MKSFCHALDIGFGEPTSFVDHNALNDTRYALSIIFKVIRQLLMLHLLNGIVSELRLNVVGARCVNQDQIPWLLSVDTGGHSLHFAAELKLVLQVVNTVLFAVLVN